MKRKAIITSISGTTLTHKERKLIRNEKPWGIILFKRNSCIKFIEKIDINGFKFFYELLALSKGKLKVIEIPLIFKERIYGNSKLDLPVVWDFLISLIHSF